MNRPWLSYGTVSGRSVAIQKIIKVIAILLASFVFSAVVELQCYCLWNLDAELLGLPLDLLLHNRRNLALRPLACGNLRSSTFPLTHKEYLYEDPDL